MECCHGVMHYILQEHVKKDKRRMVNTGWTPADFVPERAIWQDAEFAIFPWVWTKQTGIPKLCKGHVIIVPKSNAQQTPLSLPRTLKTVELLKAMTSAVHNYLGPLQFHLGDSPQWLEQLHAGQLLMFDCHPTCALPMLYAHILPEKWKFPPFRLLSVPQIKNHIRLNPAKTPLINIQLSHDHGHPCRLHLPYERLCKHIAEMYPLPEDEQFVQPKTAMRIGKPKKKLGGFLCVLADASLVAADSCEFQFLLGRLTRSTDIKPAIRSNLVALEGRTFVYGSDSALVFYPDYHEIPHPGPVHSLLSTNKNTLVSGGDRNICVWGDNDQIAELEGHVGRVLALASCDDLLFSGSQDTTVRVWQAGVCIQVLEHKKPVTALLALEDDLLVGLQSRVFVWCTRTWRLRATVQLAQVKGVRKFLCLPNGTVAVAGVGNGAIELWDFRAGACVGLVRNQHTATVTDLVCSNGYVASSSFDGTIKIWHF